MTLLDLWCLVKRGWKTIVIVPIVCALACFGVMSLLPATYSATATLVASKELVILSGQATSVANQTSTRTDRDIAAVMNAGNQTVAVTVKGPDAEECIALANEVAASARQRTLTFLGQDPEAEAVAQQVEDMASESLGDPATAASDDAVLYALALLDEDDAVITITEASAAKDVSPGKLQWSIVALVAGLLLALCIVVIRDMARGFLHNAYEVEEGYGLRRLGGIGNGRRRSSEPADAQASSLLAAFDFAGEGARALCLVPTESAAAAVSVVAALEAASEKAQRTLAALRDAIGLPLLDRDSLIQQIAARMQLEADIALVVAPPAADSADYAYLAPACGKAVLVIEAMRTRRVHVESILRQLALSDTEIAGFVMVDDR